MSASRQIRPQPGSGTPPAGNRKTATPASSSVGSGRTVATRIGKYEVETEVSGGTLVRVFHGWDRATGRRVTLKVLTDSDIHRAERFRREVAAMANLRHANLISIYELGEHVGMPFTAMEYLGDEHLAQAIAGHKPLSLLDKMRVMCQVADGVQAAHRGGLAYIGLRPRGIALCADGSAKVQDFGIVRFTGERLADLARYEDEPPAGVLDALSDVFAFGVIYYELLTGVHPFSAGNPSGSIARVRELTPECPESLEQLVVRAMEPDRELRYQSLDDVQYDAEPILREFERQRAGVLIDEARRSMESRELELAQTALREALELFPGDTAGERLRVELRALIQERVVRSRVEGLLREAEEETSHRRFARAAELLEGAARLDAGNGEVATHLHQVRARLEREHKTAQLLVEVRHALGRKDLATAEAKVLEALDEDPENPEGLELADEVSEAIRRRELEARIEQEVAKAKSLVLMGSFDEALEILSGLEAESPGAPTVAQWLAHVKQHKEETEQRERLEAQLREARSLMAHERFVEAAEGLEPLRAEFPQEPVISELLAECWEAAERTATIGEARAQCESLCREEQFEQALAVLDAVSGAYPEDPELNALRREVEEQRREFEAAASIGQVLEEAQFLLNQDRVDLAVQFLREKCAAYPDNPALAARLGAAEQQQAEWERRRLVQDCLHRVASLEQAQQWSVALTVVEEALESCPAATELQEAVQRLRARLREQELQKKLARWVVETRQALADGDIEQAQHTLRRALDTLPGEPVLLHLSEELERDKKFREEWRNAQVLVGRRQFEEAERILARLDGPQHPEVGTLLKNVREARAANEEEGFYKRGREKALLLIQQRQTEQAADLLRNLLSLFPGDPILERDLQALGGARREPTAERATTITEPPPAKPAVEKLVSDGAPVLPVPTASPAAWYRRWPVMAGAALLVLVSAGGAVRGMLRGGSAVPARAASKSSNPPRPAAAAAAPVLSAAKAEPPPITQAAPVETVEAPSREPVTPEAREARTPPAAIRRAFNGAALSKLAPAHPAAVLVPAPPIAGTTVSWVEPLPASVTPPLRAPSPPPAQPQTPAASAPTVNSRPVGGELQPVKAISLPAPVMPLIAKERSIGGIVNLEATVGKDGTVTKVKVVNGNPVLIPAAIDAVKKWRYQPAILNGQPIEAEIKVELKFEVGKH